MKNILAVFLLMCVSLLMAQTSDQKKILEDSNSFMSLLKNKNYDGIMDLTHPALFDKVNKQDLINAFKSMLEGDEEFKMDIADINPAAFKVSEVYNTKEKGKYAFVTYPMNMKMSFLKEKFDDEKKKMMTNMMELQGMKSKFVDDSTLELSKESMIIAVNDKSTGNIWKYINYDEANPLFISIVSAEVMKTAKEYYADFLIKQKENAN